MKYYTYWYSKNKNDERHFCDETEEVTQYGSVKTFDELKKKVKLFVQEIQAATEMKGVDSIDVSPWGDDGFCMRIHKGDRYYAYYLSVNTKIKPD